MCSQSQEQLSRRKCHICEKVPSSQPSLNHHLEGKHGEGLPEVECPDCGVLVKYIKQHMQSQHTTIDKSKLLKESCLFEGSDKRFRYKQRRDMHYKWVHLNQRTICTHCGQSVKNLNYHMRRVHKMEKKDNVLR